MEQIFPGFRKQRSEAYYEDLLASPSLQRGPVHIETATTHFDEKWKSRVEQELHDVYWW